MSVCASEDASLTLDDATLTMDGAGAGNVQAYRTKSVSHLGASAQVDAPFSFV